METQLAKVEPAQIWDQIQGEPDAAYTRFLAYRNLGPSRNLVRAWYALEPEHKVADGSKRVQSPGQWRRDSHDFHWKDRADKWDIWKLLDAGDRVELAITDFINRATLWGIESIEDAERPKTWRDILTFLEGLSKYAPQVIAARSTSNTDIQSSATDSQPKIHKPSADSERNAS